MGKATKKRVAICICITDSLCCTPETNTTLQINYTPKKFLKNDSTKIAYFGCKWLEVITLVQVISISLWNKTKYPIK